MKKNFLIFVLLVFSSVCAFAEAVKDAVTMVGYEQRWEDSEGTLALKNNTPKAISFIKFRLTYLDMSGVQLDYRDIKSKVKIDAGMVKKMNVEAYESDRYYSYYKSEAYPCGAKQFKIKFELQDYGPKSSGYQSDNGGSRAVVDNGKGNAAPKKSDVPAEPSVKSERGDAPAEAAESCEERPADRDEEMEELLLEGMAVVDELLEDYERQETLDKAKNIFFLWMMMSVCVVLYSLVTAMAIKRNRNVGVCLIASLFLTPMVMMVLLMMVGKRQNVNPYNRNEER